MNRIAISLAALLGAGSSLLIDSTLKGGALLVLAAVVALGLSKASAATRHLVWLFAAGALLVLPLLSALLPGWRVLPSWSAVPALGPLSVDVVAPPTTSTFQAPVASPAAPTVASGGPASALPQVESKKSFNLSHWLPLAWAMGFPVLITRLFVAYTLLSKAACRSAVAADGRLAEIMDAARRQLNIRQRIRILLDTRRIIPMVWGVFRPRLLLPAEAIEWGDSQLRSVLLHELAHIKRRDLAAQWLMQAVCALHWFNPLVWLAAWRLHVEGERACDNLVLASGVRASEYAEHVLHVATKLAPACGTRAVGVAMACPSRLEGRLLAILNERSNRRGVTRAVMLAASVLGLCVIIPVAMMRAKAQGAAPNDSPHSLTPVVERGLTEAKKADDPTMPTVAAAAPGVGQPLASGSQDELEAPSARLRDPSAIRLRNAEADLARAARLYESKLIGRGDYDKAKRAVDLRRAELRNDAAEVKRLNLQHAEEDLSRITQLYSQKLAGEHALTEARGNVELRKAEMKDDAVELARVRLKQAEAQWRRLSEFRRQGLMSQSEADEAMRNVELLRAELEEVQVTAERRPQASNEANPATIAATHFVRLVVGESKLTFESKETSWEQLPELLDNVPDRVSTVLELAIESDRLTIAELNEAQTRAGILSRKAGFAYLSYIGVHPLGSRGSPASPRQAGNPENLRRDPLRAKPSANTTVGVREVVRQWLELAKAGKFSESWQWIVPKSKAVLGPEEIHRLQNHAQIEPKRSLGSGEAAMVVTSRFQDNSGRERVAYFYLRRHDGRWLIHESELASPDDAQRRVEGFAAHPGVRFDARREDFIGTWIGGGFLIPVSHSFEADGTYTSRTRNDQGAETVHKGTWDFDQRTASLIRRSNGALEIMGSVIQLAEDFFQLGYSDGRRAGFNRHQEADPRRTNSRTPPQSQPKSDRAE